MYKVNIPYIWSYGIGIFNTSSSPRVGILTMFGPVRLSVTWYERPSRQGFGMEQYQSFRLPVYHKILKPFNKFIYGLLKNNEDIIP